MVPVSRGSQTKCRPLEVIRIPSEGLRCDEKIHDTQRDTTRVCGCFPLETAKLEGL